LILPLGGQGKDVGLSMQTFELSPSQLAQIESELRNQPAQVKAHYLKMVEAGESPRFALMCSMQRAPLTRQSDKTFGKKRREIMESGKSGLKPWMLDRYLKLAKQAGISTQGKYYVGGLGRPTDPMAWVSTVDDAKEVCKLKNLNASGLVEHVASPVPDRKRVRMAPDVQREYVARALAQDPALAAKCKKDRAALQKVAAEVVDRHAKPST